MDRNPQCITAWCITIVVSLCTHTEGRLVHQKSSSHGGLHSTSMTHSRLPSPGKQRLNVEPLPRPHPVVVHCQPDTMEVLVLADLFDSGLKVDARHLRLGSDPPAEGSACGAVQTTEAQFTFRSHLMDCGIQLSSSDDKIIYSTVLVYSPEPSDGGLLRLDGATIPVQCHYDNRYSLDGIPLRPIWLPLVSILSAEDRIDFNLLLTTADWHYKREEYFYFLGDPLHFEVSAVVRDHTPLRVYVDHCVGTATPDAEASLRYDFIRNFGCLADAYLTNSSSRFLPRVAEDRLRFQVDAFRFYHKSSNQVYITCHVKAVPATLPVSSQNKACSLIGNRWRSVDGNDDSCRSCDPSFQEVSQPSDMSVKAKDPPFVMSHQSLNHNSPEETGSFNFKVGASRRTSHSRHGNLKQPSARLMKRGAGAGKSLQLGPITILTSRQINTSSMHLKNGHHKALEPVTRL